MKLNIILTGATGMVGEGVLLECLRAPDVAAILLLGRRASGYAHHPKVRELLLPDFQELAAVESQLVGYQACFFCAGVSAVGLRKAEYERLTFDLTLHVAQTLVRLNPAMTFEYVSGAGTDGTEQSRQHWARVKGRTENALLALPFRAAYLFRPGYLHPTPGQRHVLKMYRYFSWLYPVVRRLAASYVSTMQELGQAMLNAARAGAPRPVLEVRDLVALAHRPAPTPGAA